MKTFVPALLLCAFFWGGMLYALEDELAPESSPDLVVATVSDEEVTQCIEEVLTRLFALLEETGNTLEAIKDKAAADAQAGKVVKLLDDLMVLEEQVRDLQMEFKGKEDVVQEVAKKQQDRFEILISKARIQGNRIADADFYGSAALKTAFEKENVILMYSSKSKPAGRGAGQTH